jgi:hypothetical protein
MFSAREFDARSLMLWFCALCLAFSLIVLAGRAHSRYLDRLDRRTEEAWYVLLSGRGNTIAGSESLAAAGSQNLLLTSAFPMSANAVVTLTFAQSDLSSKQGRVNLSGRLKV